MANAAMGYIHIIWPLSHGVDRASVAMLRRTGDSFVEKDREII